MNFHKIFKVLTNFLNCFNYIKKFEKYSSHPISGISTLTHIIILINNYLNWHLLQIITLHFVNSIKKNDLK